MTERRIDPRMLCADLVNVKWQSPAGTPQRTTAVLEDISFRGACLQAEEEVPSGVTVTIETPTGTFAGEVRYCRFQEIGYFVGVQFAEDIRWNEADYRPEHFLDPRKIPTSA